MIDKDNQINEPIIPSDIKYWPKKPNEQEFEDCCNEFWSVLAYVAKGMFRKELLFIVDHFNKILRPKLLRIISWELGYVKVLISV